MNDVNYLLSTQAIRERAARILDLNLQDKGQFTLDLGKLDTVADYIISVIEKKYPDWNIPYHSRWGHFKVGGNDRVQTLLQQMPDQPLPEKIRTLFDLVIVSVLLDAGAGAEWHYQDETGQQLARSEGLAIASFEMFKHGMFSSDPQQFPWRVDSRALMAVTSKTIEEGFQVTASNPLSGVQGRAELMVSLGKTIAAAPAFFGSDLPRPGHLFDYLLTQVHNGQIEARHILHAVLTALGPIWPGRIIMEGVNLGDCWQHKGLGDDASSLVPFHKLSQWLTYSLLEPMEMAGINVIKLDELTPLAEYRNGGLLIDSGLITPKDALAFTQAWSPDSKLVIEWRALTIVLIDRLAKRIRDKMNRSAEELPLAKVLEGGTWWAGRKLAEERRGGKPPLEIISDGTVF